MINDYKNWFQKKQEFLHHLYHHDSIIMHRIINVLITLDYIGSLPESELNEDYDVIFEEGYKYLFETIGEVEIYLDKYFDNNLHKFLEYEELINYALYLNELKATLLEQGELNQDTNEEISDIQSEIDEILIHKEPFTHEKLNEYDARLLSTFVSKKHHLTVPEVYDRIAEELQIV